jgi:hypothetical protein
MLQRLVFAFLIFLPALLSGQPSDKDTAEINEPDFKGYIMPLDSLPWCCDEGHLFFTPIKTQVLEAEAKLKHFLSDTFCRSLTSGTRNREEYPGQGTDCKIIKTIFSSYFRQYAAYTSKSDGHRYLYILCVSPQMQSALSEMKKAWMNGVEDGGPILFHATIDVDTWKIEFHDNGWA